jgi:hypothetical protein
LVHSFPHIHVRFRLRLRDELWLRLCRRSERTRIFRGQILQGVYASFGAAVLPGEQCRNRQLPLVPAEGPAKLRRCVSDPVHDSDTRA